MVAMAVAVRAHGEIQKVDVTPITRQEALAVDLQYPRLDSTDYYSHRYRTSSGLKIAFYTEQYYV